MKQMQIPCNCGDNQHVLFIRYDEEDDEFWIEFKVFDLPQRIGPREGVITPKWVPYVLCQAYDWLSSMVIRIRGAWRALRGNANWYMSESIPNGRQMQILADFIYECKPYNDRNRRGMTFIGDWAVYKDKEGRYVLHNPEAKDNPVTQISEESFNELLKDAETIYRPRSKREEKQETEERRSDSPADTARCSKSGGQDSEG